MRDLIHKEDLRLLLPLGVFLVIISSTNTLLQICGDALFISNIGIASLPLMYIVSALVLAVIGIGIIPVIDRMERRRLYNMTAGLLASGLLFLWLLSIFNIKWVYYLIYITTYILEAFLFLEFWLIAGDICHTRQAKRIFPILLSGGLVAGSVTAFLVKILAPMIQTRNILLLCSFFSLVTVPLNRRISRFFQIASFTRPGAYREISTLNRLSLDLKIIWQSRLVRTISLSFVLYTVLSFILDFKFNQAASFHFTVGDRVVTERLAAFYGIVKGWVAVCAMFLQFFLSHRLINRAGVCDTYVLMPFVFLLGFLGIYLAGIFQGTAVFLPFYAATFARLSHKSVAGSLYRSSGELLYNAIPAEKRGRVRAFQSSIVEPLGVALAGGLIIIAGNFSLALAVFFSLIYIAIIILSLKKNYIAGIVDMLNKKSGTLRESMSGASGRYGIKEILGVLQNALNDREPGIRIFACQVIGEIHDKKSAPVLLKHLSVENENEVKENILKILVDLKYKEAFPAFESALTADASRIRRIAIDGLGSIGDEKTLNLITPFLNDKDSSVQARAITACWRLGGEKDSLRDLMQGLFKKEDLNTRLAAIELAGSIPIQENLEYLLRVVDPHPASLRETGSRSNPIGGSFQIAAIKALGKSGKKEAAESLIKLLERRDNRLSNLISAALRDMGGASLEAIEKLLWDSDIYASYFLFKALEGMARNEINIENISRKKIMEILSRLIRHCYYNLYLTRKLDNISSPVTLLLHDALLEENRKAQAGAITGLKFLDKNSERMDVISRNLSHPDAFVRSNAIEALENIGEHGVTAPLIDILEDKAQDKTGQRQKNFSFPELDITGILGSFIASKHAWLSASAIFAIGELKLEKFKNTLLDLLDQEKDPLIRANAFEALLKMGYKFPEHQLQSLQNDPNPLVRRYARHYPKNM